MADTMRCPYCKAHGAVIDGNLSKCDRCQVWMNLDEVREIEAQRERQRQEAAHYQAMIAERNALYQAALEERARLAARLLAAEEERARAEQERRRIAAEKRRAKKRAGLSPSVLRDIEAALGQGMTRPQHGAADA